jgi:hypothetical protein
MKDLRKSWRIILSDNIHIFTGPTINHADAVKIFPAGIYHDPISQGDIPKLIKNYNVKAVAIIDGFFEGVPSVWHKEILHALSENIFVFGSSSMGALRAAELHDFGMVGTGEIFNLYYNKIIEDDDEVAVLHGPKEIGYHPFSEAMVNIRATLKKAIDFQIINYEDACKIIYNAKELFYKKRNYHEIIKKVDISSEKKEKFIHWVEIEKVDQKRKDAEQLLYHLSSFNFSSEIKLNFIFNKTVFWRNGQDN